MPLRAQTLHVSIVDDDDSVRKGLSRLMRSAGIQSQAYDSPEDFLAQAHNKVHACILMDITMPRMHGPELSAQLRAKGITLPVIAISARDDDNTRQLTRELGVKFFLRKPVDDQALLDAISWVVQEVVQEDKPDRKATPGSARPSPFIVRLNADRVLGEAKLNIKEDGLKQQFPLDAVPLKRCENRIPASRLP